MIELKGIAFELLYEKANAGFQEWVANERESIEEDLGAPVESVSTRNNNVRITFYGIDQEQYLLETMVDLVSNDGVKVGWYCLHEDENGETVDDFLVLE